jgi:hypothetical protein
VFRKEKDRKEKEAMSKLKTYYKLCRKVRLETASISEKKLYIELDKFYKSNPDQESKALKIMQGDVNDAHGKGLWHRIKLADDKLFHKKIRAENKKEIKNQLNEIN